MQIDRIELASADPGAQARFWGETLGAPVEKGSDGVSVRLRRSTIAFMPAEPGQQPRYHFAINVPGGSTAEVLAWLEERVEPLPFEDDEVVMRFDWIGADSLYFHDAGGNIVELMARDEIQRDQRTFGVRGAPRGLGDRNRDRGRSQHVWRPSHGARCTRVLGRRTGLDRDR